MQTVGKTDILDGDADGLARTGLTQTLTGQVGGMGCRQRNRGETYLAGSQCAKVALDMSATFDI